MSILDLKSRIDMSNLRRTFVPCFLVLVSAAAVSCRSIDQRRADLRFDIEARFRVVAGDPFASVGADGPITIFSMELSKHIAKRIRDGSVTKEMVNQWFDDCEREKHVRLRPGMRRHLLGE